MRLALLALLLAVTTSAIAADKVLNIYAWSGELPDNVIREFENSTGIKVNFSPYENNEILYAKLRVDQNHGYDLILPSSYYVDKMRKKNMLTALDKSLIPNLKNLDPYFRNPSYDPGMLYSVPHLWGVTGIFINDQFYRKNKVVRWDTLWEKRFYNQLMLLDDVREVFAVALISLGYSANSSNPEHIKQAYLKLKKLLPNVKVFSSETVISLIIDEDARVGMAWNGDTFRAQSENNHIKFILPKDGFVIWVDNFAIPKNARHKTAAYQFINFVLQANIGKQIAEETGYPIANLAARQLLPAKIRNSKVIYPTTTMLKKGEFQTDISNEANELYEKYWELLKLES